jgi:hypothetical protein
MDRTANNATEYRRLQVERDGLLAGRKEGAIDHGAFSISHFPFEPNRSAFQSAQMKNEKWKMSDDQ